MNTILFCPPRSGNFWNMRGRLLLEMIKNNLRVIVLLPRNKDFEKEVLILKEKNISVYTAPFKRNKFALLSTFIYAMIFCYVCKKENVKSVISYTLKPIFICSFLSSVIGIKNRIGVFTGLGNSLADSLERNNLLSKVVIFFLRIILRFPKKIIVQNKNDFHLLSHQIKSRKIIIVNGSGVDLERFNYRAPKSQTFKFLFAGRFNKNKGLMELLNANKILFNQYPSYELILVGDQGEDINEISVKEINKFNPGNIVILKFSDNIEKHMIESSVLVLPSYREGTPRSIIEGFAIGRPCIVSDVPGCYHLVPSPDIGLLVEPKSIESLKNAMKQFLMGNVNLKKMSLACRSFAVSNFDDLEVNNDIIQFIKLI